MGRRISASKFGPLLALLVVLVAIPLLVLRHEAERTGRTLGEFLGQAMNRSEEVETASESDSGSDSGSNSASISNSRGGVTSGARIDFVDTQTLGDPVGTEKPWITHLEVVDLDRDGLLDVVACDAKLNRVQWIRQHPLGTYTETSIGTEVRGPAHVSPIDIDADGDVDLLVAKMGVIFPSNDKVGAVVLLENTGGEQFVERVLADKIARVCDVRAGDLDGDGDLDLAVAQFGYDDGEIRWMRNDGNWQFESEVLLRLSGTIHTPIADMDGDGDLDIVALVSQEWEETYVFENDGQGNFTTRLIYGSTNEDFGSSGIAIVDLDQDDDPDVLYTNGDAFDYLPPGPRPWHGVQWLENKGGFEFDFRRIGDCPGAYFANAVDVDHDQDLDVFVVSCFNDWDDPDAQSLIWFENDGAMGFTQRDLISDPTHLLVLDTGDMDGDGWVDLVTGGFYAYPPFDRMSRFTLLRNLWGERVGE